MAQGSTSVSMLVQKQSLRWRRLCRALWHLWTHTHRVQSWRERLLLFSSGREDRRCPSPDLCAWCRAVEFFRRTSTTCQSWSSDGHGAPPLSRSEYCIACVRLRQFRFRDRVALLPRERLWGPLRRVPMIESLASGL